MAKRHELRLGTMHRSRLLQFERRRSTLTNTTVDYSWRSKTSNTKGNNASNSSNSSSSQSSEGRIALKNPRIKKLTPIEMRERRAKGLCYNCDAKFEVATNVLVSSCWMCHLTKTKSLRKCRQQMTSWIMNLRSPYEHSKVAILNQLWGRVDR